MSDNMEIPQDWTFKNVSVASHFDRHVREQLPWYETVSGAVAHIARHYIPENGQVFDIGCSTGNISRLLAETLDSRNAHCIGIDNSPEMFNIWKGHGVICNCDATEFEYGPFDVAVLFLCLMFISVPKRQELLQTLMSECNPGGAIIIVDKTEAPCGYVGTILHRLTIAGKVSSGATPNDIIAKELSLSGVQRPLRDDELPNGFVPFFRFGEFAGWIYESPIL